MQSIMQNARLDESQAGLKVAGRNNNLRYADDTTLMAGSDYWEGPSELPERRSSSSVSIKSVMPSGHLILCRPLLLLPPILPSIRVCSNESTLRMRWSEYWSFMCVEPAGLCGRCTGVAVPLRVVPSPTGLPSKRGPGWLPFPAPPFRFSFPT